MNIEKVLFNSSAADESFSSGDPALPHLAPKRCAHHYIKRSTHIGNKTKKLAPCTSKTQSASQNVILQDKAPSGSKIVGISSRTFLSHSPIHRPLKAGKGQLS
jgi:hypothetical protein